jgi:hypothetical protein
LLVVVTKCPEFGKKKKDLSRYHKQESRLRFSLSTVTTQKKKTGRCAEAQGLVVVGSKSPKSRRAKRIPFLRFAQAKPQFQTPVLFWMINVCRVRFCVGNKSKGIKQARSRS